MGYWTNETSCQEVCRAERLIGYCIFFSGGWDAYRCDGPNSLLIVGRNFVNRDGAERAVVKGHDWRKEEPEPIG